MCGRYATTKTDNDLRGVYGILGGGTIERELEPAQWGLRPHWMNDPKKRGFHNARLETVADKLSFRSAFTRHRAIVPMDGYYEWVDTDGGKQPYFHPWLGPPVAAGLYEFRKDDEADTWEVTYTIITRTARDASGEVHDRMPVFLTDDVWTDWMSPENLGAGSKPGMLAMLDDVSTDVAATLETYPVSKRINNVRTASPTDTSLLDPVDLS